MAASFMSLGSQRKNAMVGISVEPLVNIEGQTPAAHTEAAKVSTFMEFGQKMVENLFNYASSFAVSGGEMRSRTGQTFVPSPASSSGTATSRGDSSTIQTSRGSDLLVTYL